MKTFIMFCFLMVCSHFISCQEICDNGIDDDGDTYIDINDPDCACAYLSLIPNPSFEERNCCPSNYSQFHCLDYWMQSSELGTTDYFNSCDYIYDEELPIPPMPFPDGEGFIGFFGSDTSTFMPYKEYASVCLNTQLITDTEYQLSFFLGFGEESFSLNRTSPENVEISLFGSIECYESPYFEYGCPFAFGGWNQSWEELGSVMVSGKNEWKEISITFTAQDTFSSILIGSSCSYFTEIDAYFFLDRVILNRKSDYINLISGDPCSENAIIGVEYDSLSTYQWYRGGIAIPNSTTNHLLIPPGPEGSGIYQLMIQKGDSCFITAGYEIKSDYPPIADLGIDTFICDDHIIVLGDLNYGDIFLWNTEDTSRLLEINSTGEYSVTVSNECGEEEASILIEEIECDLDAPNVFTPNGDGLSDHFYINTNCCILKFDLKIYARFGNLVFESKDIQSTWDGTFKNTPLPSDTYFWTLTYSISFRNKIINQKKGGDITLIR